VTCPIFNSSRKRVEWFHDRFLPLKLSGIEEAYGRLIPCLRPKLNEFIPGQFPDETAYDIGADDLPVLLRLIIPGEPNAWAELLDRNRGTVAIAKGRRFTVEWREWPDWKAPAKFTHWRAQDPQRLAALGGSYDGGEIATNKDPDSLRYADTLRIFQAFLRGELRPAQYAWRNINPFVS